jgi:RNA polymerase sigma-70 factor (ECF subfamily)
MRPIRHVIVGTDQRAATGAMFTTPSGGRVPEAIPGDRIVRVGRDARRSATFQRLADEHLDAAYRLASAILRDPSEAQDAVHDAFLRAWAHWSSLRDEDRFEAWFGRIVVNTCRDRLRRVSRWGVTDISGQLGPSTPDASGPIHDREQVARAMLRLKPDDRVVLALRYYRDLKVEDIADLLGIPPGTATSRLRAAHARLRTVLADALPGEGTR